MADTETARLCVQTVHSHFGPLTANVASVVLTRGRLTLSQIARFSSLKLRTVRAAILVLVQHNLLWHSTSEGEGEVLEFNIDECLTRLRFGRYVWLADLCFGKQAAEIVELILDHGKLRPPEIVSHLSIYDSIKGPALYTQTLYKLVTEGYLKPATILSHQSPREKQIRYETEEKDKIPGFPTAKELRQAKEIAYARLKREEEEAEKVGLKPKPKDERGKKSSKKKAVDEDIVDDEVFFRVNFDKFNIHIRNQLIEAAAKERYNESTASVLRAVLKATESKQKSVTDIRSDPASTANVALLIPEDEDLSVGLALGSDRKPSNMTLVKEYLGFLSCADNPTLAGKQSSFVSLSGAKVQVEFEIIARRLQRQVLESAVREKHGNEGVRIVRLLLDTGKMDEKQVSKVAMMAPKDARPLLSAMNADSFISLQEVPRSADRNPTRTFFLWYVDLSKAYLVLLRGLYKTLYNIGTRRRVEEEELSVKAVLEKRQRSDVSQDIERLLTRNERETLTAWEERREKLTVAELRVEEAVFILRTLVVNEE